MRIFTLVFAGLLTGTSVTALTVATFDDLTLHGTDTEYVNYASMGADVGFNDGLAFFPCVYDTSYGDSLWEGGFAYSNWTDSISSANWADSVAGRPSMQYAAKTGIGYAGSANYAVAFCSNPLTYANNINLKLTGAAIGQPVSGFYITNTSYAYSSMKYGDEFDTAFTSGDWFLLTIKGYSDSVLTTDSVNFYLADYRFSHADSDYIVDTWLWVNLLPLGHVDSLQFSLSSSNNTAGSVDVPSYFCMDDFTTDETGLSVKNIQPAYVAKVYPNPAINTLYIEVTDKTLQQVSVIDMTGNVVLTNPITTEKLELNISSLSAGNYLLQMTGAGKTANVKFVKQ